MYFSLSDFTPIVFPQAVVIVIISVVFLLLHLMVNYYFSLLLCIQTQLFFYGSATHTLSSTRLFGACLLPIFRCKTNRCKMLRHVHTYPINLVEDTRKAVWNSACPQKGGFSNRLELCVIVAFTSDGVP